MPSERQAVSVIYAACRVGDDAVDESASPDEARAALERWWEGVERAYAGVPQPHEPLELALSWVLERYDVPKHAFDELRLGFVTDLAFEPFESVDELMVYCRRVAGVVGLMVAPIAGYRGGEKTLLDAVALGQAMQLTNILRDVGEDLAKGRCYLPRALLAKHGVELADLRAGRINEGYVALIQELTHLARRLYRLGWQSIPKLRGVASTAVGLAALNYEAILDKLERNGYDNLSRRAHLRGLERLALIPRAVYGVYASSA
jgi:phytoene synthase